MIDSRVFNLLLAGAILAVSATPTAAAPPTVTQTFAPAVVAPGSTSTLTLALNNSNTQTATLSQDFRFTLADGLFIASTHVHAISVSPDLVVTSTNPATTCGGEVLASALATSYNPSQGSRYNTVTLPVGAQIPAGGCVITVTVTAESRGSFTTVIPAGALQTDAGANSTQAMATVKVVYALSLVQTIAATTPIAPTPVVTSSGSPNFSMPGTPNPSYVANGGSATIALALANPSPASISFSLTDTLPAGLVITAKPTTDCTSMAITIDTADSPNSLREQASIAAGATCTLWFGVAPRGTNTIYTNTIGRADFVSSGAALTGPVAASLTVGTQATPSVADRANAANSTAINNAACVAVQPFYWEIGDKNATLASGNITTGSGSTMTGLTPFSANKSLPIASAGKWFYSAYMLEKRHGVLSSYDPAVPDGPNDVRYLNFKSGYPGSSFSTCVGDLLITTVDECFTHSGNDVISADIVNLFDYGGGHMQAHADRLMTNPALAPLAGEPSFFTATIPDDASLAQEIRAVIDPAATGAYLTYSAPQLAGGAYISPSGYARFLRNVLNGSLAYSLSNLDTFQVNTNPNLWPAQAYYSPGLGAGTNGSQYNGTVDPPTGSYPEDMKYGIGHWTEDSDPAYGDGAFSSPGLYGFYPWIDKSKTWYGMVARAAALLDTTAFVDSMRCGREIRQAWATGEEQ